MKIPRCRATVSEDTAAGHWSDLGRPGERWSSRMSTAEPAVLHGLRNSLLASQETGANYNTNPFRE